MKTIIRLIIAIGLLAIAMMTFPLTPLFSVVIVVVGIKETIKLYRKDKRDEEVRRNTKLSTVKNGVRRH